MFKACYWRSFETASGIGGFANGPRIPVSVGLTQSLFRAGVNYQFSFFKTRNGSGRSSLSPHC